MSEQLKKIPAFKSMIDPDVMHLYTEDGKWKIRLHKNKRATRVFDNKGAALSYGIEIVNLKNRTLIVHYDNAMVEKVITKHAEL